jgi:hypothetical protein
VYINYLILTLKICAVHKVSLNTIIYHALSGQSRIFFRSVVYIQRLAQPAASVTCFELLVLDTYL